MPQLLSPRTTTTEARAPRPRALQQEKPKQGEARAPQRRVAPARHNQRKPAHSNEDPTQSKINKIKSLKKKWYFGRGTQECQNPSPEKYLRQFSGR